MNHNEHVSKSNVFSREMKNACLSNNQHHKIESRKKYYEEYKDNEEATNVYDGHTGGRRNQDTSKHLEPENIATE